jgi:hypothetical protein
VSRKSVDRNDVRGFVVPWTVLSPICCADFVPRVVEGAVRVEDFHGDDSGRKRDEAKRSRLDLFCSYTRQLGRVLTGRGKRWVWAIDQVSFADTNGQLLCQYSSCAEASCAQMKFSWRRSEKQLLTVGAKKILF